MNVMNAIGSEAGRGRARIIEALCVGEATQDKLAEAVSLTRRMVGNHLAVLVASGRVLRKGQGVKADPYIYSLVTPPVTSAGADSEEG